MLKCIIHLILLKLDVIKMIKSKFIKFNLFWIITLAIILSSGFIINPVSSEIDLAKARVGILQIQWRNNPPGSLGFKVEIDMQYARN